MTKRTKTSDINSQIVAFCNEIATLFEINKRECIPNFASYSSSCSKSINKTDGMLDILSDLYHVDEDFSKRVFEHLSKRYFKYYEETNSSGKRNFHRSLYSFFEDKKAKKKKLIILSSLISVYYFTHQTFNPFRSKKECCDEYFFLRYIKTLTSEILNQYQINLDGSRAGRVKLEPAKNFNTIDGNNGPTTKKIKTSSTRSKSTQKLELAKNNGLTSPTATLSSQINSI